MMTLSKREKIVLGEVVRQFILNGVPVSSSLISQKTGLGMSPATIRNILADLEKKEYIYQPHTSAGRVPKTSAYRLYVDNVMKKSRLSADEKDQIYVSIRKSESEFEDVLKEITRILAQLSQQLGIIVSPKIEQGIFQRMEIISLSSEKLLLIMSIESGFIKTVTVEVSSMISREKLQLVSQILNERLHGMNLAEIRSKFHEIVKDIWHEDSGLVKIFAQKADRLFDFEEDIELYFNGTDNIFHQPGFSNMETVLSVVGMLEDRSYVVHLLDEETQTEPISIKIGEEINEQRMRECSMITARYRVGNINGILGIIGSKRIDYSKMASLVEFTARTINDVHGKN
jgi:heat-inducible transcriptional repressor